MSDKLVSLIPQWPKKKEGEYWLLFHSSRCRYWLSHPVSVIQSSDMLWGALLRCDDDECFVSVGSVKARSDVPYITAKELHNRYRKVKGHSSNWIPREDRRGIRDPKTPAQLATWIRQQPTEGEKR